MDKRIGYGLTYEEALKLVSDTANKIPNETVNRIHISTDHHAVVWAENRSDGWRVYVPPSVEEFMTKPDTEGE